MKNYQKIKIISVLMIVIIGVSWLGIVTAAENTGQGKPKGVDIFVDDVPYGASLGGAVASGGKQVGDFNVIVDDDNPEKADPGWFTDMGITPTQTPTITPTPTATSEIPVNKDCVGTTLTVTDPNSEIIVDFAFASADYKNTFSLSSPNSTKLGWSQGSGTSRKGDPFGANWSLGTFPAGTELIFTDIAYSGSNYVGTWKTGPASVNTDKFLHATITLKNNSGTHHKYLVSFEDSKNGGDKDYNDVEFYVSGALTSSCIEETSGDSGSGAVIPVYMKKCRCDQTYAVDGKHTTCIAQFSYRNTGGVQMTIPVRNTGAIKNEFTGSGMVGQNRCQPAIFYVDPSENSPFWTNRFWNNIKWKLMYDQSDLVTCDASTPLCNATEMPYCAACTEVS